jgi:hypothetical protein
VYKLVILIAKPVDPPEFRARWPEFLRLAETLPGLRRQVSSPVTQFLSGEQVFTQVHELFFITQQAAKSAMASLAGQQAGKLLQSITGGQMILFIARHIEDNLEDIETLAGGG